ncbi:MAG: alpha/beta hydrolase [Capsulimonas sp.]|uniref:alpha/beta hydrolase n=1 Tax=Capsulimonas sp. TaxID=2494211 RepID=UPI0032641D6F
MTRMTSKKPRTKKQRVIQFLVNVLAVPCLIYIALLTYLYFNQRELIFPGSASQYQEGGWVSAPPPGCESTTLPMKQGNIAAIFAHALKSDGQVSADDAHSPTVIYFYGNGGSIASSLDQVRRFQRLGCNVIVPDYQGFGMSGGTASEAGCYAAADAAYRYALGRKDVDPKKLVFAGWSIGSAVAIDLASKHPCAALMTFSAFTSMAEMANSQYPIVPLPMIRVILKHKFLSEEKIRRVRCPVLIGHSHADKFVPYAMADRLAANAGGPVTRLTTTSSDHSDFFRNDNDFVFETADKFILQNVH